VNLLAVRGKGGAGNVLRGEGEQIAMSQIAFRSRCLPLVIAAVLFAAMAATTPMACAQEVVLLVNGEPITNFDIAHREKFIEMSTHKAPSRQQVINSLIDEILELKEAERYTVVPSKSDIEQAYDNVASNMGVDPQKLTQILNNGGASEDTLKQQLKAQMAWTGLVRGRYKASLEIADTDVEAELQLHKPEDAGQVGYEYVVRPIIMIVQRGSPDSAFEARKHEADALRVRFLNCADGIPFARGLANVAVRDPINKSSADLPPALRSILDNTEVGHLTPAEQTVEGIQMFAVCSKKESKEDAPGLKEIRDKMFEKKFGAKANRYLADLRRQAMIEYKQ
jgi:peptidyl-prolyl cis-trans isomerase SurA